MAEEKKRDTSVPIWGDAYSWWTEASRSALKKKGMYQKDLAAKLDLNESEVSRAITREKPLYEVLIAIADELELPYPVLLPESEEEAEYLAMQRRLFRRDKQIEQIKPGGGNGGIRIPPPAPRPRKAKRR